MGEENRWVDANGFLDGVTVRFGIIVGDDGWKWQVRSFYPLQNYYK